MAGFVSIDVQNDERFMAAIAKAPQAVASALIGMEPQLINLVKEQIYWTLNEAARHSPGFFDIYRRHVLDTALAMPVRVSVSAYTVNVEVDLYALGDYGDFEQGFHYGAQIDGGGQVDLPYSGEELKNDTEERYQYWLSVLNNTHIPGQPSGAGKLGETLAARVSYWESIGKAPEWLMLQYGELTSEPYVQPYPIIEAVEAELGAKIRILIEQAIDIANEESLQEYYEPRGVTTGAFKTKAGLEYIRIGGKFAGSRRKG